MIAGLLLIASLAGNVVLLQLLKESFSKLQFSRIFPLGYSETSPLEVSSLPVGTTIALFGDSRALLWRDMDLPAGYHLVNEGHGGETSRQLVLQLGQGMRPHTTWAVVQIGINDLHPLGVLRSQSDLIVENLRRNLSSIVDELLQTSDNVIVMTIIPPGHVPFWRRPLWHEETLSYLKTTNAFISQLGSRDHVFVLDADAALRDETFSLDHEFQDPDFFLHINRKAYELLNEEIKRLILPAVFDPAAPPQ